ncbi:glycosyltransferase family 2 protein [Methylobacterium sp. HMF5984]|uniref:glycosyltransferase family 2 protein n=1 Tax=Methylobacterium sp. HMF5984 TaxID=3367370 RepID=UPI003854C91D
MISLIIPTRNRAHTLKYVAPSYFSQDLIDQIIFVIDAGQDDTIPLVEKIAKDWSAIDLVFIVNNKRMGASESRNIGCAQAKNDYVMFVDDDEYLESGYARICLEKLKKYNAGAVSGRRIYMLEGETPQAAISRFGIGLRGGPVFWPLICEYVNGARFRGDIEQPITNSIILTKRSLLIKFPFDSYYSRGNGYREETDYQMSLFVNNYSIIVTNDTHSIHLPKTRVAKGGQTSSIFNKIKWSIIYTNYFYNKFYAAYARRLGLHMPKTGSLMIFVIYVMYRELIRPPIHHIAMKVLKLRSG